MAEMKHTTGKIIATEVEREEEYGVLVGLHTKAGHVGNFTNVLPGDSEADRYAIEQHEADAARIVACWNACEGIADPSAVPDAIRSLRMLLDSIDDGTLECTSRKAEEAIQAIVNDARRALAKATTK